MNFSESMISYLLRNNSSKPKSEGKRYSSLGTLPVSVMYKHRPTIVRHPNNQSRSRYSSPLDSGCAVEPSSIG